MAETPRHQAPAAAFPRGAATWALAGVLVVVCYVAGAPRMGAPWIQGDEHIFIARNPDVTGEGTTESAAARFLRIFEHTHEDLYQPLTILTYAMEWRLWGEQRVYWMRQTDVLIHAVNALLVWAVLARLLAAFGVVDVRTRAGVGWMTALLWATHPMFVGAYAADMGRTHLLAATFTLLSLLAHLNALATRQAGSKPVMGTRPAIGRSHTWFALALLALLGAMLNKPVVGWVAVVFTLEWLTLGLRRTLAAPRVYLVGALCAGFALLTLSTTRGTLLLEDSPLPLFGDPLARAALSLWFYLRNFFAPLWLSPWYPPAIDTNWGNPRAWIAGAAALAAGGVVLAAIRRPKLRGFALGAVWLCANWLPISGVIGARVLAAQDRYLYLPSVGLLLILALGVARWIEARPASSQKRLKAAGAVAALLAAIVTPFDRLICEHSRSTLARALWAQRLYPQDPRVLEYVAAAYNFGRDHVTPEGELPWTERTRQTLLDAAEAADRQRRYFPDEHSRAAFDRRLSFVLWQVGAFEDSLALAQRAHELEPNERLTWLRLAHAYRSLGRLDEATRAYERLEQLLTPGAPDRGKRLAEFGDLLLTRVGDLPRAMEKFRAALACDDLRGEGRTLATLGLARCEVLAGQGSEGFKLASGLLRVRPNDLRALLIVALYHLRSDQLEDALAAYRQVLAATPADYEALRGHYEACLRLGAFADAATGFRAALEVEPTSGALQLWFLWAAACAGDRSVEPLVDSALAQAPAPSFAFLAKMLFALRDDRVDEAVRWAQAASKGAALPGAQELQRANMALAALLSRGALPPEAEIARAAIWIATGDVAAGRQILEDYLASAPESPWAPLARTLGAEGQR
jgi:tetratricopeptide (TPR) repeat protein